MGFNDVPLFMTPDAMADITGEHVGSIRRGIREGRIPADKVNGRWLICRDLVFGKARSEYEKSQEKANERGCNHAHSS